MKKSELNALLEREQQERMGSLYDQIHSVLQYGEYARRDLERLVHQYGQENVAWMLRVIKEEQT